MNHEAQSDAIEQPTFRLATPPVSGAIGIIELHGHIEPIIQALTQREAGPVGSIQLRRLYDARGELIDTGLVARLTSECAWFMPHGGPRILQRLRDVLIACGAVMHAPFDDPIQTYVEAATPIEAYMLATLSRARSSLAVDLLIDQPQRWDTYRESASSESLESIRTRSRKLNRLIDPPIVVVIGPPNAGKSSLTNALAGRSATIASEQADTTRDYVGVLIDLGGLTVWWCDTAGRRNPVDEIESAASRIADSLISRADLLIEARSPDTPTSETTDDRPPNVRVLLKSDLFDDTPGSQPDAGPDALRVSVLKNGEGIRDLVVHVREQLVPQAALEHPGPWLFDERVLKHLDS